MGKGIALAFKKSFPIVMEEYTKAIDQGLIQIGRVQVVKTNSLSPKYVINFPTKKDWRHPSKVEYIEAGLIDLIKTLTDYDIKSISVPPLGCGNGKLKWEVIKPIMIKHFTPISERVDVTIFEPGYSDQRMIQKTNVSLTPARAMLIYLLKQYQVLGYTGNLLVAQKLSYLLQRFGEPLNLDFEKGHYGPYAHRLLHLLKYLNGYYLWFKEEDNKPGTAISIDVKNYQKVEDYIANEISFDQKKRLDKVLKAIEGFESPYGLELLATVDFIMQQTKSAQYEIIERDIHNWTNRKRTIMKPYHIKVATKQVVSFDSL
jgi:O-acetyl-ADP-ribose deacetylase (regulator of RNase III)